jgi:hypothetical protein
VIFYILQCRFFELVVVGCHLFWIAAQINKTDAVAPKPLRMGAFQALVFPRFQGAIVLYPSKLELGGKLSQLVRKFRSTRSFIKRIQASGVRMNNQAIFGQGGKNSFYLLPF